ncbi:hypothetical protein MAM1_0172d07209 [Mucor ambiguus]|uniref:Uncharacterized protein n=1 Tax=Mucor ambiguus TaxID=91626 RepID=A0A0C9MW29_9FUNG|nr:hypothetical protein MAM1_0172d07209 [Mucor ambiguus]
MLATLGFGYFMAKLLLESYSINVRVPNSRHTVLTVSLRPPPSKILNTSSFLSIKIGSLATHSLLGSPTLPTRNALPSSTFAMTLAARLMFFSLNYPSSKLLLASNRPSGPLTTAKFFNTLLSFPLQLSTPSIVLFTN